MNEITAGRNAVSFASLPKKDMAASLCIHIVAGILLLTAPLMIHSPNPQTISVTFHDETTVSNLNRPSAAVMSARKDKVKAAVHRQVIHKPETTTEYTPPLAVAENHPVEMFREVPNEKRSDVRESPKGFANAADDGSEFIDLSARDDSAKTAQPQSGMSGALGDARFGERGAPAFIHREMPVYPALARRLGKEGKVLLKLFIDADGKLKHIEVVETAGYGFTEASLDAVKKSTYAPGVQDGAKIAMRVLLPVSFRLQ